jgi:hypothetical protein
MKAKEEKIMADEDRTTCLEIISRLKEMRASL